MIFEATFQVAKHECRVFKESIPIRYEQGEFPEAYLQATSKTPIYLCMNITTLVQTSFNCLFHWYTKDTMLRLGVHYIFL